jgi:hypothetical protein
VTVARDWVIAVSSASRVRAFDDPFPFRGASIHAGHGQLDAGFIDEFQAPRVDYRSGDVCPGPKTLEFSIWSGGSVGRVACPGPPVPMDYIACGLWAEGERSPR